VSAVRLDLQTLTVPEAVAQVRRVISALEATGSVTAGSDRTESDSPTTTGHFFRGLF
jgi:hypothetical protein